MVTIDKKEIWQILENVTDPEIPVLTIADLGILQDIEVDGEKVIVHIIPTYTGCPAMDMITVNIRAALQEHQITEVEVKLTLSPVWSTDMISEAGKQKMREYGIAPPVNTKDGKPEVSCPQCDSQHTELISHFGSTACKALYRCLDCKEPFDYFKCH